MSTTLEIHWPTDEEEAEINAGIEKDPEAYVMTDEEWLVATGAWRAPSKRREVDGKALPLPGRGDLKGRFAVNTEVYVPVSRKKKLRKTPKKTA